MANWSNLKKAIQDVVKTNGNQEITGALLQQTLVSIVSSVGENATCAGVASPTTNPGVPDGPVFWFALDAGTYVNFGGAVVPQGLTLLYNKSGNWQNINVFEFSDNINNPTAIISGKTILDFLTGGNAYSSKSKVTFRKDKAENWISANPVLADGELCFETDTKRYKLGDGKSTWNELSYFDRDVDDEPIAGSENFVKSGGIAKSVNLHVLTDNAIINSVIKELYIPEITEDVYVETFTIYNNTNVDGKYRNGVYIKVNSDTVYSSFKDFDAPVNGILELIDDRAGNASIILDIDKIKNNNDDHFYAKNVHLFKSSCSLGYNPYIFSHLSRLGLQKDIKEKAKAQDLHFYELGVYDRRSVLSVWNYAAIKSITLLSGDISNLDDIYLWYIHKGNDSSQPQIYLKKGSNGIIGSGTHDIIARLPELPNGEASGMKEYITIDYPGNSYGLKFKIVIDWGCITETLLSDNVILNKNLLKYNEQYKKIKGVSSIKLYVPDDIVNHTFELSMFGLVANDNFYFRIYDSTTKQLEGYGISQGTGLKKVGIETFGIIVFYDIKTPEEFYYAEVTIDWNVFDKNYKLNQREPSGIIIDDVHSNNELTTLRGPLLLDAKVVLPDGINLKGENCSILCGINTRISVGGVNSTIENIVFNYKDDNSEIINREEDNAYRFTPIKTRKDYASPTNELLYNKNTINSIIYIKNEAVNAKIDHCTFNNINTCCIYNGGGRHEDAHHSVICNNMFNMCRTGIYNYAEFSRISDNMFYGGITGIVLMGNNAKVSNCAFVRMDCAFYCPPDNNAHSEISNSEAAHCNIGLYIKTLGDEAGLIFNGCQFAQAPVIGEYVYGLRFNGCRLDTYFDIESGKANSITMCNMRSAYLGFDGVSKLYKVPDDTYLFGNVALDNKGNDYYNKIQ